MSKPRLSPFRPRRSNFAGGCRRVLPALAALVALGFAPGAASAFQGFELYMDGGLVNGPATCANLQNLQPLHDRLDRERRFDEYTRRGGGYGPFNGFILYGYWPESGWIPLYFVPQNLSGVCD